MVRASARRTLGLMASLIMRGRITRVVGVTVHVEVPDLGVGYSFGPVQTATETTLAVGDQVLVVSVGGITEDVVVVGKLNG